MEDLISIATKITGKDPKKSSNKSSKKDKKTGLKKFMESGMWIKSDYRNDDCYIDNKDQQTGRTVNISEEVRDTEYEAQSFFEGFPTPKQKARKKHRRNMLRKRAGIARALIDGRTKLKRSGKDRKDNAVSTAIAWVTGTRKMEHVEVGEVGNKLRKRAKKLERGEANTKNIEEPEWKQKASCNNPYQGEAKRDV